MNKTVPNAAMIERWDGPEGENWAMLDDHYQASFEPQTGLLFAAANIAPSDRVLDIGCGCGHTTRRAAGLATAGRALGVDVSGPMLRRARDLAAAEAVTNVEFLHADAQVHDFDSATFDVAISKNGCMFFEDPVGAFANIGRALKPDGRLALLTWQAMNESENFRVMRGALAMGRDLPVPPSDEPSPFALSDRERVDRILSGAGFSDVKLTSVEEPMFVGADLEDAYGFVSSMGVVKGLLEDLDAESAAQGLAALKRELATRETTDGIYFESKFWLTTARRR